MQKTIKVKDMINIINRRIEDSIIMENKGGVSCYAMFATKTFRIAQQTILDIVLEETGTYAGFEPLEGWGQDYTKKRYYIHRNL